MHWKAEQVKHRTKATPDVARKTPSIGIRKQSLKT